MNTANFYCKKTDSFAKCNDSFPLHAFYLNAHPQRDLGDHFQDFLFICLKKKHETLKIFAQAFVCLTAPEQLPFCRSEEAMGA